MSGRWTLIAVAALALAGCGGSREGADVARSDRLVDFGKQPPYVNALEIAPADESFLLTTNRGFYRIPEDGGEAKRMTAKV
ncbi:MAG TPA: hypothetical protein VGV67_14260, partial [Solirubrobacteraceae bacterium]|nr:hypothetical protein [Solirubrobacteraceae bacterium]